MRKEEIIKVTIIIILVLVVIAITGCQSQIPCSIEITSPNLWESVNGNEPYEITWDWTGPMNKKVDIFLAGYTKEEIELGTILIESNILGSDGQYIIDPNLGTLVFEMFGTEGWPWWFKIKMTITGEDTEYFSDVFEYHWWNPEWD